ncbi:MAG TPA: hypothetical protein VGQ25_03610 [Gemmatimonadales bacterium]|jgi:hypothetical protein|nr:hypothetical protein [Gemmatimonadales bacterium]
MTISISAARLAAAALGVLLLGACGAPEQRSGQTATDSGAVAAPAGDTTANSPGAAATAAVDLRPLIGSRSSSRGELPPGLAPMAAWMVLPGPRDPIEFRISDAAYQGQRVLLLEHVYERDSSGHLTWEVADAMLLPAVPDGHTLVRGTCGRAGSADGSIAAIARADARRGAPYRVVTRAWRADLKRRRLEEIPTAGLRCINKPLGGP